MPDHTPEQGEKTTCGNCGIEFIAYQYDGELEDSLCFLCVQEYEEGQLFDRDNFGDQ